MNWSAVPILTKLADLGTDWRRVAQQVGYGQWEWLGDLSDTHTRAIYQHMLHQQKSLTQVMQTPKGTTPSSMLFAQMRPGYEAKECIAAFRRSMRKEAVRTVENVKKRHLGRLR